MPLVFQYGSNASRQRLNAADRLNGAATGICLARTSDDYDLAFTYQSRGNQCAVADLVQGSRKIYGGLYDVPSHRLYRTQKRAGARTLDEVEGEGAAYRRITIPVSRLDTGELVEAETYVVIRKTAGLKTASHYVAHILNGLREFGAPEDYLNYVKDIAVDSNPLIRSDLATL